MTTEKIAFNRKIRKSSSKRKLATIVSLLIFVIFVVFALSFIQSTIMDSVRAYVRGEGLYAKAQKDAVTALTSYSYTQDKNEFQAFQHALLIPLGARQARETLQSDSPDYQLAYQGFLVTKSHPDDIDGMIHFFLNFEHFPYMKDAIALWTEADQLIAELEKLGFEIKQAIENNDKTSLVQLTENLKTLNNKLNNIEYEFSLVLSEGAHWITQTSLVINAILISVILALVLFFTRRIFQSIIQTEQDLLVSENRFESLFRTNLLAIVDWDKEGAITDANQAFLNMLGFTKEDLKGGKINWKSITPAKWQPQDEKKLPEILKKGHCKPFEKEFIAKNGQHVPVYLGAALLGGESSKGIAFFINQSETKKAQKEMRLAATVFNSSSNGIIITDQNFCAVSANETYLTLTGQSKGEVLGNIPEFIRPPSMTDELAQSINQTLLINSHWHDDLPIHSKVGIEIPVEVSINAVKDNNGQVSNFVIILNDITERVATEKKLRYLAQYDYLTGLANRAFFAERHSQALHRAKRLDSMVAILFIDLDKFKPINDQLGHEVGDGLLKAISERITSQVRDTDTVGRLGGDEFVVLLEDLTEVESAKQVATKIISAINHPFSVNEYNLSVGCSIGIAMYPEDAQSSEELIKQADLAMYHAKEAGRNRFMLFKKEFV